MEPRRATRPLVSRSQKHADMLTMEEAMRTSAKRFAAGEIVKGIILEVRNKEVLVDIGYKSEGVVSRNEFLDPDAVKVGDEIDVLIEKLEDKEGMVILSHGGGLYTVYARLGSVDAAAGVGTGPGSNTVTCQPRRRTQRTDRRRRSQHPQPPRAHLENVAGVDRQQGRGPAQQNRHHVERDRTQQDRAGTNEGQPREDKVPSPIHRSM